MDSPAGRSACPDPAPDPAPAVAAPDDGTAPAVAAPDDGTGAAPPPASLIRRLGRRALPVVIGIVLLVAVGTAVPYGWVRGRAAGHLYAVVGDDVPRVDVVLVLGSEVAPGGREPMPYLRGRLDTAAELLHSGHARVVLLSGDARGNSGNETAVMTGYLTGHAGVPAGRIVADPDGLDTYDSCARARQVFGVDRLLVVTQSFHLPRAVALCRHAGIDTAGVAARCDRCERINLVRNGFRDYFAASKAALDALRDRPPAVASPPSDAVRVALSAG